MAQNTVNSTPHASHFGDANQAGSSSFPPMKQPLSYGEQVDLMVERGLDIPDRDSAERHLSETNYYRLRGYWLTYEQDGHFLPGTSFEEIWDTYLLDVALGFWLWNAIEPIEIKARTSFAYRMSMDFGPLSHRDASLFTSKQDHKKSMDRLNEEIRRSKRDKVPCVVHNLAKYGDLPVWAAVETMTLGTVSSLYGNLSKTATDADDVPVVRQIASDFGTKPRYLKSWLRHLTYVRNICGHHGRIYNRIMTVRPLLLKKDLPYAGNKGFPTFLSLARIYQASWPDRWPSMVDSLRKIVDDHGTVSLTPMGFPSEWESALR